MKSTQTRLIVSIAIATGAIGGYLYWYSLVTQKSAEVANLEAEINARTEKSLRIVIARATLAEIEDDEQVVQNYFVAETEVVRFIEDLQRRAKDRGATLKVASVASAQDGNRPILNLSLGIDGPFDSVVRTVGVIEYAPYDLVVNKLTIDKADKTSWHAAMDVMVTSITRPATTTEAVPTRSVSLSHL